MAEVVPFPDPAVHRALASRPFPPELATDDFAADPALAAWVEANFLRETGPLCNPRHAHLREAMIGWLWTSAEATARDRTLAGQCELVAPMQRKWSSARSHWLLRQWFGVVPDFLVTIDAGFAASADDWSFCALIEHELCHAAQDVDVFGEPRFNAEGQPTFRIVGHDVEQFHDVVERYGAAAAGVEQMTRLANAGPIFGQAEVGAACGTCARRTA